MINLIYMLFFIPMFSSFLFFTEFISNSTLAGFLILLFVIGYLISFSATIMFVILKIINIKLKSDKIKKINKTLFILFYIFVAIYISTIAMMYISRYLNLKKHGGESEREYVSNFNYGATGKAAGFSDTSAGYYQWRSDTGDLSFISAGRGF